MKINITVYELCFWRISIILLWIGFIYLHYTKPMNIETYTTYYATFLPEGEIVVEEPKINKSMGCNIYWRAKGYPCYDL